MKIQNKIVSNRKMFINKITVLFLLTHFYLFAIAQISQSPNAASFERYGFTPVSTYTGIPNISIPIWELRAGDIRMPISLSYHASGIKVEQIASWVGLGWNLNVGGVITRQVKGLPDFEYLHVSQTEIDKLISEQLPTQSGLFSRTTDSKFSKDAQPDIFTYNFNGNIGQFVIDHNTNVFYPLTNNRDFVFKYNSTDGFEIITPDGISYKFNSLETQKIYSRSISSTTGESYLQNASFQLLYECTSAWYLTEVVSLKTGHTITFTYEETPDRFTQYSEPSAFKILPYDNLNQQSTSLIWSQAKFEQSNLRITGIATSSNVNIVFTPQERNDLQTNEGKALEEIDVRYGSVSKKLFAFNYDYFCVDGKTVDNALSHELRLKLTSFCEEGKPCYNFNYYEDYNLPARLYNETSFGSHSKDNLGYYNGKSNSGYLMGYSGTYMQQRYDMYHWQNKDDITYDEPIEHTINESGADRSAILNYCQTYSLKEVVHSTGGRTQYIYGLHDYSYIGQESQNNNISFPGLRINEIIVKNTDETIENRRTFTYKELNTDYTDKTSSSGTLVRKPQYFSEVWKHMEEGYPDGDNGYLEISYNHSYLKLSTNSINPIYDFTGGFIGYNTVKEDLNGNGFKIYNYYTAGNNNSSDNFNSNLGYFFYSSPQTYEYYSLSSPNHFFSEGWQSPVHKRGLLVSEIFLNNNLLETKVATYDYQYVEQDNVLYGVERTIERPDIDYWANLYSYSSGFTELASKIVNVNDYAGSTSHSSMTTNFSYNDLGQLTSEIESNINSTESYSVYYTYPNDIVKYDGTAPGGVIGAMRDKNMINVPIQVLKKKDDNVIGGSLTEYQLLSGGAIVPQSKYNLEINSPLSSVADPSVNRSGNLEFNTNFKQQVVYDKYDAGTNLLEYHSKNGRYVSGQHISYIYGYNSMLPEAKIINASTSSVALGNECSYIGFESNSNVENLPDNDYWFMNTNNGFSTDAHTGKYSRKVEEQFSFSRTFEPDNQEQKYKLSCWVKTESGFSSNKGFIVISSKDENNTTLSYQTYGFGDTSGEWKYVEIILDLPSVRASNGIADNKNLKIDCYPWNQDYANHYFLVDDVRFQPVTSEMATYTYEPLVGITSETDARGYTIYYKYDDLGRLLWIKDMDGKIIEQYKYNYDSDLYE